MNPEISFGSFVKKRRREMDLTQEELARRVGCATITVRKIEANDLRPSVQIAERLAMALAIPLDDRAEFVRRARSIKQEPLASTIATPPPSFEEIGREDLTGRAIRGYSLAERIGVGGMGSVYRAIQPNVEREVAIKIILPVYANQSDFIRRFEAEAQLVARLEHPHIVPLYDYWREPGVAYLVMRLVRGGNLQNTLSNGPLSLDATTHILEQICVALNAAHRIGVIHRDLKPANVLLDEDNNAYLADFGIAKNISSPDLENQTKIDEMIGTPQYMSPEQIRSLAIKPQTDIYCLGIMLYEMLTGILPFAGPTPIDLIQQHINTPMPSLSAHLSGLPATLDDVIERATAKNPDDRYDDVLSLYNDYRQAVGGVLDVTPIPIITEEKTNVEIINPFKGLHAFKETDAENFFGRESFVQQLMARMGEGGDLKRFLAVIGPSGSGKSSTVRAGLIPALRRGGLPGSESWFIVDMLPGKHPFEELETALQRVAVSHQGDLLSQMKDGNRGLLRAAQRILPTDKSVELVIVIDQFEEIFTLLDDETERALFLENLVTAVLDERSRLRIVITLRADFTDKPLHYVDFGEMVNRRFEFILPLTPDELESAILNPAQRAGLKLEKGLVSTIIHEVDNQPGALPLMQFALSELFHKRNGRMLTQLAYSEIGGVLGALGRSAEKIYTKLDDASKAAARQLFLRLVTLGEGTEDTRRRIRQDEIEAFQDGDQIAIQRAVDAFGNAHLLSFDRDPITRNGTIELAHEALIREWVSLREWLIESRTDVRMQRQLGSAMQEWDVGNRDTSFLMTGSRLRQFEEWSLNTTVTLMQDEQAFLSVSITERDHRELEERTRQERELQTAQKLAESEHNRAEEQAHAANRMRIRNRVISIVGVVALIFGTLAMIFNARSTQNAAEAEANLQQARIAESQALSARAQAIAEKERADEERDNALTAQAVAQSRELAASAIGNLANDPERSVLLALEGLSLADTREVEEALHRSLADLRILQIIEQPNDITSVSYSPDGKLIVTAHVDGLAHVWDVEKGQELFSLVGHTDFINKAVFSPDGKLIATASDDETAIIWDAETGEAVFTLAGHSNFVFRVIFGPDGKNLATGDFDGTVKIWEVATGEEISTLSDYTSPILSIEFNPNGTHLAASSTRKLIVWDIVTGEKDLVVDKGASIAYSPDGKQLALATVFGSLEVISVETGEQNWQVIGHPNTITWVSFSPDGAQIASSSYDGTAKVWDSASGELLITLAGHAGEVGSLDFSPDGKSMVTSGFDHTVRIWDISPEGSKEIVTVAGRQFRAVNFGPDDQRIVTASHEDGIVQVWDVESGQEILQINAHDGRVFEAVFSPDGTRIATCGTDNMVKIWDSATGQELLSIAGHGEGSVGPFPGVLFTTFSPDGTRIATAGADGIAKVWDAETGEELLALTGSEHGLTRIRYNSDGSLIATASGDPDASETTARIWDAETGKELLVLTAPQGNMWSAAFDPEGDRLVTVGMAGVVKIWDIETGQELIDIPGFTGTANNAAFSPDGSRLVIVGADGVHIWDLDTKEKLLELHTQTGYIAGLDFNKDWSQMATASLDGTTRIIYLDVNNLIELAKARVTRSLTTEECQQYLHMEQCP